MGNYPLFDAIIKFVKENKKDGKPLSQNVLIRHRLAELQVRFEIGRLLTYRVALVIDEGRAPNIEAALAKAYSTAFEQHLASTAMNILGLYGQLLPGSKLAPSSGMVPHSYLASKGYSLQAGTSEILRNVIATRGLGLPTQ
jgi:alkylation response protein AidB-like acyl-CoA dehydrogenase